MRRVWSEAGIKHELFDRILALDSLHALARGVHLLLFLHTDAQSELVDELYGVDASKLSLTGVHGTHSAVNADLALNILQRIVQALALHTFSVVFEPEAIILLPQLFMLLPYNKLIIALLYGDILSLLDDLLVDLEL